MRSSTQIRTHGYKTKRELPARPGKPKVCTRCDLWFLAGPRERACYGCLSPSERARRAAHTTTPERLNGAQNAQVRGVKNCAWTSPFRLAVYPELARAHARAVTEGLQGCYCRGWWLSKEKRNA